MFADRIDAAKQLAEKLSSFKGENVVVLGLPRGGVPVAAEVARALGAPLDIIIVRKLGAPGDPEFAIGAISEGGEEVLEREVENEYLESEKKTQQERIRAYAEKFRRDRGMLDLSGKTAVLVDDGIATGATMRAAIKAAKGRGASRVIVATPVAAPDTIERIKQEADEVVVLEKPAYFMAVGQFYADFPQVSDEEVVRLLEQRE